MDSSFGNSFVIALRDNIRKQDLMHTALLLEKEGFDGRSLKCFLKESLKVAIDLFRHPKHVDESYTVKVMLGALINTPNNEQVRKWTSVKILNVIDMEDVVQAFEEIY